MLGYRGGLYLLGLSHTRDRITWLAIDRIDSIARATDEQGHPIRFPYPRSFDPARHTNGMFGIVEGDAVKVDLAINNPETEAYLRERRIHPSQHFSAGDDGRTRLEMTVRGTTELANWILGLSPYVEVLRPAPLREEIRGRLQEGVALHAPPRRRPARATPQERSPEPERRRPRRAAATATRPP